MSLQGCVFSTALGWWGVLGQEDCVWRVTIGHRGQTSAWESLRQKAGDHKVTRANWHPELRERLEQFAAGEPVDFNDICVRTESRTPFQQRVLAATRAIPFGETISYGELAALVDAPNAARAVGSVMASNQVPIIIPCHRVVGSRGALGGFSAPSGLDLKIRLLDLERFAVDNQVGSSSRR